MRVIKRNGFPIRKGMDAITIGTWIFIRPNSGASVLPHEKVHVKQFKADWLMPIKYLLSKRKRYEYELEAYKVSIQHGLPVAEAVRYLSTDYGLGYSHTEIEAALRGD